MVGIGVLIYAYTGAENIAAAEPHWKTTIAVLNMVRDRSIAVRSDGADVLDLEALHYRKEAISHDYSMRRHCHGVPGRCRNEFAEVLYPSAPNLTLGDVQ